MRDNAAQARFELPVDGGLAVAVYRIEADPLVLVHTEVPERARGQGVAGRLAEAAMAAARDRGMKVTPRCPMMAAWMRKHPETRDLLSDEGKSLAA